MEHTWLHSSPHSQLPFGALIGGHDCDGSPIYVGRSNHEGENLPAKVIPSKGTAYVSWGGQEIRKSHYEVLVGQCYGWIPCYGGAIPPNAVSSGFTRSGEPLYIGRGRHENSLTVGKIHPSHGCLYIPFGGQERCINNYEVLVRNNVEQWVASAPNYTPPGAVVAGHDTDNTTIYVGRAMHEGEMLPAKVVPSKGCAYVCYGGYEINKCQFEVLTGFGYTWVRPHHLTIPPNAVSTGRSRNGEPLFVGRGHYHGSLTPGLVSPSQRRLFIPYGGREIKLDSYEILYYKWVQSSVNISIPPHAVIGGNDSDGGVMYVGRSFHNGDMLVAKVIPSKNRAIISWRGQEVVKDYYEILCSQNTVWRHCYDHVIPANALLCGQTALGQPVYIGRGLFEGSLTVGKVSSVHRALFIAFGGIERRLETYEILITQENAFGWSVEESIKSPLDVKVPCRPPMMLQPPAYISAPSLNPCVLAEQVEPPPSYCQAVPASISPIQSSSFDLWMSFTTGHMPHNAVHAGYDSDNSPLLVCRAFHQGDLIPGKAVSSKACAYISSDGCEILKSNFEILVGNGYCWVTTQNGNVPPGAVQAGRTCDGEPLYVGRALHCGSLTPGKIQRSHHCLYIPFRGREQRISNHEVLVRRTEHFMSKP